MYTASYSHRHSIRIHTNESIESFTWSEETNVHLLIQQHRHKQKVQNHLQECTKSKIFNFQFLLQGLRILLQRTRSSLVLPFKCASQKSQRQAVTRCLNTQPLLLSNIILMTETPFQIERKFVSNNTLVYHQK